jgi:predicted Mrr-cat superfamily restriction endonuclease
MHHEDQERLYKWSLQNNRIALGWSSVGDLTRFSTEQEVKAEAIRAYGHLRNRSQAGGQLWSFSREMKVGDLVILSACGARLAVVEVSGDYEFDPNAEEPTLYGHQRRTVPSKWDANELWVAAGGAGPGQGVRRALVRCQADPRE